MQAPIVEISSDDEGETETQLRRSPLFKRTLLADDDADDEITVIDSFPCFEKKNSRPKRAKSFGTQIEDLENDCLVLDGDPDKVVADPGASADESEDLVVTAEKGQVACRDFPHPRHLCVKFPFKNTPHEKYCEKCHCYVCDKPAPCLFWGKENPDKDHCHSSDKEEKWKKQRSFYKMRDCKEPPRALQHSFNTILSLTTMRTTGPVSRSNQASVGAGSPFQLNLSTDAMRSPISTRSDQQRPLYSTHSRNHTANKDVPPSRYINHVGSQNPKVGRSASRFGSSYRRDPSNLGLYGQGAFGGGSNGSRFSADSSLQRQRNRLNTLLTNNNRSNTLDSCSITQTQSINIHSSEQIHVNDMLHRDVTCVQNPLIDESISKLWEFLLGGDSEESSRFHNDSSSDLSLNITLNPSSNSNLSNITAQPNSSTQSSSSCVALHHELKLLPQSSVSVGVSNAADSVVQWPHSQNMPPPLNATEQYPEHASYFNYDWLHETAYSSLHAGIEPWSQFGTEGTATDQTWNYVAAEPSTQITESRVSENINDHNPIRHDAETVVLTAQPQQPEWAFPQVPHLDVTDSAGQMCSEQGFAESSTSAPALFVDLNNSWETLAMRQDLSSYFECT